MALITKPKTLTNGTTADATDVESNFNTIYNDYNGNITNANLASGAAIADSKLAQLTTASKVSGTSLTGLASISTAAGYIPVENMATGTSGLFLMATSTTSSSVYTAVPIETSWTDYFLTSTKVGWSSITSGSLIYTKKIGNTIFVSFNIAGTSDNATTTFTVPYTNNVTRVDVGIISVNSGGTQSAGLVEILGSTATANLYKDMSGGAFTASGAKSVIGQFFYESA